MEFDITYLDKHLLLQTLFTHAAPISLGQAEYNLRKSRGENVDGLTQKECELFLSGLQFLDYGGEQIVDYYKGKPIKLVFFKNKKGRVVVDSDRYDSRNGKYRFFEAMLNVFSLDEILITKKGFQHHMVNDLPFHLIRPKEIEERFKLILRYTVLKENKLGKYWAIDEDVIIYDNPVLAALK